MIELLPLSRSIQPTRGTSGSVRPSPATAPRLSTEVDLLLRMRQPSGSTSPSTGAYISRSCSASTSDTVDPTSPNGSDFFRGGVSKIVPYRQPGKDTFTQIYFSVFDYGLYRSTRNHQFEQVFVGAGAGAVEASLDARTEFALAPMGAKLRIYLGDVGSAPADFYRTDDANVPAASLRTGHSNRGWIKLSNSTPGTAGFSSYDFCQGQCSYDMFVATPPGQPNTVGSADQCSTGSFSEPPTAVPWSVPRMPGVHLPI